MTHGVPTVNSANGTHAKGTLSSSGEVDRKFEASPAGARRRQDSRFPQQDLRGVYR